VSRPVPSNSFLVVSALVLSGACALLLAPRPGDSAEVEALSAVSARESPLEILEDAVEVRDELDGHDLRDVSFADLSSHSCGPVYKRTWTPEPKPKGLDLKGSLRAPRPLDLVVRITPLERLGGEPLGPSLAQQAGPEGEFCFRELAKGVYRMEVLHTGTLLGVRAHTGYSCPCAFDGSARASEIVHDDQSIVDWTIRLSVLVTVEVRDQETGELVPDVSLGHVAGEEPGRASMWRNLVLSSPPPLISAPGYARTEIPLEHYARPTELVKLSLEREAPLRIRCQDEEGRPLAAKHWFYVHQADESCPRSLAAEADCEGMGTHSWSRQSRGKSEVVIRGLPPSGIRSVTLISGGRGPEFTATIPSDQRLLTITISASGSPTFSRE